MQSDEERRFNPRDSKVILLAVLSFAVLAVMVVLNYHPPDGKTFGLESYYVGNKEDVPDYVSLYNKMYATSYSQNVCQTQLKRAEDVTLINNISWIVGGQAIASEDELRACFVSDDGSEVKPYTDTNREIVSPGMIHFENSNISSISTRGDGICIKAKIGTQYTIEWKGVKSWWCHMGKENPDKHTQVVGKGGGIDSCKEGFIIGEATKDTIVSLSKVSDGGEVEPCSFLELYRYIN